MAAGEQPNRFNTFAVRLWTEDVAGGTEVRGRVEDVANGAYIGFRDWSDMIAFMLARVTGADHEPAQPDDAIHGHKSVIA